LSKNVFNRLYRNFFKRFFDIIFSFLALIVLSPLLLIIALLVRIKLGSPIIFKQERPGLNEKIFTLYKYRTMTDKKDEDGNLFPDSERLTTFGKWLRSTSLDELPELWNILKGEMSFVGPRPLLMEYLPRYSNEQRRRHEVRPGLTGLAQVNGRNAISWEEKFSLDIEYVHSHSFFKDTKIILQSINEVLFRKGISSSNSVTMEEFLGQGKNAAN
jgi:undecaprenyl phosphate N,N'-diacetylbacillosamine 1-phosphate transferase